MASALPGRGGAANRDAGVSAGIAAGFFLSESGCTEEAGFAAPGETDGGATGVATRRAFGVTATAAGGFGANGGGTSFDAVDVAAFAGVDGGVADCAASVTEPNARISAANVFVRIMVSP